jgi:hypothetical protein
MVESQMVPVYGSHIERRQAKNQRGKRENNVFADVGNSQVCYHFITAAGGIHIVLYVSHLQPW